MIASGEGELGLWRVELGTAGLYYKQNWNTQPYYRKIGNYRKVRWP